MTHLRVRQAEFKVRPANKRGPGPGPGPVQDGTEQ
jgi:hypothetical protein